MNFLLAFLLTAFPGDYPSIFMALKTLPFGHAVPKPLSLEAKPWGLKGLAVVPPEHVARRYGRRQLRSRKYGNKNGGKHLGEEGGVQDKRVDIAGLITRWCGWEIRRLREGLGERPISASPEAPGRVKNFRYHVA
jgi:hypothetical protein